MRRAEPKRLYYALSFTRAMALGWVVFDALYVRALRYGGKEPELGGLAAARAG